MALELDYNLIKSIESYVIQGYVPPDDNQQVCLLDTMIITRLAKIARDYPEDFEVFLNEFENVNAIFYIPETILAETAKNQGMTSELYGQYHEELFVKLSEKMPIRILSFQMINDVLSETMENPQEAFLKFRLLNVHLNQTNKTIQRSVEDSDSVEMIFSALSQQETDLGERILHLLTSIILEDGVSQVFLYDEL